jgi:hypothetical protein
MGTSRKSNLVYQAYRGAKQKESRRLVGMPLRKHLIANICRIMTEYAPEVGVLKKEIAADMKAIRAWKLDAVTDWFYLYDALGSCGKLDIELHDFYAYARARWWYNQLSRLTDRPTKQIVRKK